MSVFIYKIVSTTNSLQMMLYKSEGRSLSANGRFPHQLSGESVFRSLSPLR